MKLYVMYLKASRVGYAAPQLPTIICGDWWEHIFCRQLGFQKENSWPETLRSILSSQKLPIEHSWSKDQCPFIWLLTHICWVLSIWKLSGYSGKEDRFLPLWTCSLSAQHVFEYFVPLNYNLLWNITFKIDSVFPEVEQMWDYVLQGSCF